MNSNVTCVKCDQCEELVTFLSNSSHEAYCGKNNCPWQPPDSLTRKDSKVKKKWISD